ncbi:hypothetical protein IKE67_04535 [bacterium]|nr:hypothetical protein [bacterium]
MRKNVIRYILIFSIILFGTNAFSANEYNNELLKIDVDQTTGDTVRVNIYTDKPYKDKIIVNKRPDNKYVILLPETANSVTSKPDISGTTVLNDVEVKTQQYSSLPGKGYTKIILDGKKPIEIVPQAFTTKKASAQKKTSSKPYLSPQQVQTAVPQRILNQQKPVTNNDFVPSYERQRQLNQQQNYIATQQQSQPSTYVRRESAATQYTPERTQTPVVQPQVLQEVTQPANNAVSENVVNQDTSQEQTQKQEEITDENDTKQAIDDAEVSDEDISEDELVFFKKIIKFKQKVVRKIKKILSYRISFTSFITVLQLILLVVLVKVISDLVKKVQSPTEPQPLTKRLIHDNDETFEQAYPSYSNMDVYNTNRSNFEEDGKEGFNIAPISAPSNFTAKSSVQSNSYSNGLQKFNKQLNLENDFYRPLSEINEEERMSIFDENSQDIEKTIFKNPLTKISKHDEEILFDEIEPAQENTPFAENNEQEDFFDYSGKSSNDEDFFIFEDEDEDEDEDVEYQEDYLDEDEEDEEEYEYVDEDEYDEEEYTEHDNKQNQEVSAPKEPVNPFEHLTVQSKYVIDSNRGFAQVSVDGVNALIGYVGSKISVIRKFTEEVKGTMQVRLNEQPDPETMIYIIKVGSFKTLVEVKPQSIRQLLDL